jgi:hypothetical protein
LRAPPKIADIDIATSTQICGVNQSRNASFHLAGEFGAQRTENRDVHISVEWIVPIPAVPPKDFEDGVGTERAAIQVSIRGVSKGDHNRAYLLWIRTGFERKWVQKWAQSAILAGCQLFPVRSKLLILFGSSGRTRTYNPSVNS